MEAFEYQTVKVPRSPKAQTKALNAYGLEGWEVTDKKDAWQSTVTVTMRRVRPGGATIKPKAPGLFALIFGALTRHNTAK